MIGNYVRMMAVAVGLVGFSGSDGADKDNTKDSKAPVSDSTAIEGLWSGGWGAVIRDGIGRQGMIAELFIKGDHVELSGFHNVRRLTGTVRIDASAKRMHITPAVEPGGQTKPKAIEYTYEIKADRLTLIDSDKYPISFGKRQVVQDPLANVAVDFVTAAGINAAGDLLVTEFSTFRVVRDDATYFHPENRSLKTKQATVLLVQETGLKKVTIDEARKLVGKSTPVVVTYRHDEKPAAQFRDDFELSKEMGPPLPDSKPAGQMFARILRPGTLVFILSARENIPQP
jgi:hypothetical protein